MLDNVITGIGGFVASHLADYLLEQGESTGGTCRWTEDLSNINHIKNKISIIPMDLNDLTSCLRCIEENKPKYIYHLAAQSFVPDSYIYPFETIRTNTLGTFNLLEAVRLTQRYDKEYNPVIHVCSSSEVYGLVNKEEIPINENTKFNPSNPYAVGKVGEDMLALMYYTNYHLNTIRTRMFTHTGPRRVMMSAEVNFAKQIAEIEQGIIKPKLHHGNLNSVRTWADVRDAVIAYHLLVRKCKAGSVYNIGGDTTKTIGEMLHFLLSQSPDGDKIELYQDPALMRPYDVSLQIPDCSKFKNETGWQPKYTFEQTMTDLLNYWRDRVRSSSY
jgi:GDP-mannose 4,6-dehydratase